jgi:hypothetical protein
VGGGVRDGEGLFVEALGYLDDGVGFGLVDGGLDGAEGTGLLVWVKGEAPTM